LHLGQESPLRRIAKGILQKDQLCLELLKLLDQQPLMGVIASQPIGGQEDDGIELAAAGRIAQAVQGGAIKPCAAEALIDIFMLG
jgi:hypothetical protein